MVNPRKYREFSPLGELHANKYVHDLTIVMFRTWRLELGLSIKEIVDKVKFVGKFPDKEKTIASILNRNGINLKSIGICPNRFAKLKRDCPHQINMDIINHGIKTAYDNGIKRNDEARNLKLIKKKAEKDRRESIIQDIWNSDNPRNRKIYLLREAGATSTSIADRLNISYQRVDQIYHRVKELGGRDNTPKIKKIKPIDGMKERVSIHIEKIIERDSSKLKSKELLNERVSSYIDEALNKKCL